MSEFDKNKSLGKDRTDSFGKQTPGGARPTETPRQPMGGVNQKPGQTQTPHTGGTGNLNKWDKNKTDNKQK